MWWSRIRGGDGVRARIGVEEVEKDGFHGNWN